MMVAKDVAGGGPGVGQRTREHRGDRVQPVDERRDHGEVAAAAPQPPQQVGVFVRPDLQDVAAGGDDLRTDQVVAREAVPRVEPPEPTTEGQPGDPGAGHHPERGGQSVTLRRSVELPEQQPGPGVRDPLDRIDGHVLHAREVEHDPPVADCVPRDAVAAAADGQHEVVIAGVPDPRCDVARVPASDDRQRSPVDHRVEHGAGVVVPRIVGADHVGGDVGGRDHGGLLAPSVIRVSTRWLTVG